MKCKFCGYDIPKDCDGIQVFGPDPFASEIHDDWTEVWLCQGQIYDSCMEI